MRRILPLCLAFLAACQMGQRVETSPVTNSPAGVRIVVGMKNGSVRGELLTVEDSSILIVDDSLQLVRIHKVAIKALRGKLISTYQPFKGEKLRLLSRYPAGVTAEIERLLMAAYRQQVIPVILK